MCSCESSVRKRIRSNENGKKEANRVYSTHFVLLRKRDDHFRLTVVFVVRRNSKKVMTLTNHNTNRSKSTLIYIYLYIVDFPFVCRLICLAFAYSNNKFIKCHIVLSAVHFLCSISRCSNSFDYCGMARTAAEKKCNCFYFD